MTVHQITLPADMPSRMRRLPRDEVGRPIPFFVAEHEGKPDFRFMESASLVRAVREQLCWVCGVRLGRNREGNGPKGVFVAGPMCLVNRTSAEPPSHGDCAEWSAKACPFLTKPLKERRNTNMPEDAHEGAGIAIMRNPGVTALIGAQRWRVWNPKRELGIGNDGLLFDFDRVEYVRWMSEGKAASSKQVMESIDSGVPALTETIGDDPAGWRSLAMKLRDAMRWVPPGYLIVDYPNVAALLKHVP